jgi:hypothetical protein
MTGSLTPRRFSTFVSLYEFQASIFFKTVFDFCLLLLRDCLRIGCRRGRA